MNEVMVVFLLFFFSGEEGDFNRCLWLISWLFLSVEEAIELGMQDYDAFLSIIKFVKICMN